MLFSAAVLDMLSNATMLASESVQLAESVRMPTVGFGCAGRLNRQVLQHALAAGYTMFDTSQAMEWYDEAELGEAINASGVARSRLFLTSKLHPRDHGETSALRAFPTSLKRLGTAYLDAFLLHYPHCFGSLCDKKPEGTWRDSWRALEALHMRGDVRAIGVSNFSPEDLKELLAFARVRPHLVQSWMDPLYQARALRQVCSDHGVVFQAYSTLGTQVSIASSGAAPLPFAQGPPQEIAARPSHAQSPYLRVVPAVGGPRRAHQSRPQAPRHRPGMFKQRTLLVGCPLVRSQRGWTMHTRHSLRSISRFAQIAQQVGRSTAQVALCWALQHGAAVIPRSSKPKNMAANLQLFDFKLDDEQMAAIDALDGTDASAVRAPPPPPRTCNDQSDSCGPWADSGECDANPGYMHTACAASCDTCGELPKIEL